MRKSPLDMIVYIVVIYCLYADSDMHVRLISLLVKKKVFTPMKSEKNCGNRTILKLFRDISLSKASRVPIQI